MTGRRAIVGLCMLCALLVSAVAAQSASALGTTGVTCVKGQGKGIGGGATPNFRGEHCLETGEGKAEYGHVAYTGKTTGTLTNEKTAKETTTAEKGILKTVVSANPVVLTATGVHAEGTIENIEEGGEMVAKGETEGISFTGVTVSEPANCIVKQAGVEGTVKTKPVKATTKGQGMSVKFEPKEGTLFAEFEIIGASCPEFIKERNPIKVFGSVSATPNGATLEINEEAVTAAGSLHMFSAVGPKAGLEGKATIKAHKEGDAETKPITATTE